MMGNWTGGPPGGEEVSRVPRRNKLLQGLAAAADVARNLLDDLITTFFPADCRACTNPLLQAGLAPICDDCLKRISPQSMTLCWHCGEALGMESDWFAGQFRAENSLCTPCRMVPPEFERAVAFGVYQDELRTLIHLLKYERVRAVAKPLGAMLARAVEMLGLTGDVALVAVPLYPAKERQRGYNQAVLLADAAIRQMESKGPRLQAEHKLLQRLRDTESQFALTPKGRRKNLKGAFAVPEPARVAGRTVLLVDDIYTTGATARECARVLRRAGAARIFVATLARAQAERVERWDAGSSTFEAGGSRLDQIGRSAT